MVEIATIDGIKSNHIYECVADYKDPFDESVNFKKGDMLYNDDIKHINKMNIQFFKLIGGKDITHSISNGKLTKLHRRPVEIGDVFFVKFARIKFKHVVVLDVLEDCEMAAVYPTSLGYLPLGCLVREEHRGWIDVNYKLDFKIPNKAIVKENNEFLGNKD